MRIPKINDYDTSADSEIRSLEALDIPRRYYNLGNLKDKTKWIKSCETLCRSSLEYKDLIEYLKVKMGMNFCSFFHNVSKEDFVKTRIRIEIHHEPFTLFDIVAIVLQKRLDETDPHERIDMYDIADEVMQLHYRGHVGLIPLSATVHELVHSGNLFVPLQFIDEGFYLFFQEYKDTIKTMDGLVDTLKAKVNLSKKYKENPEEFIAILKKRYIYVANKYDSIPKNVRKYEE